jgi:4-amino-4-deoxy-L-arabinose transferase-like glycosyltransferase
MSPRRYTGGLVAIVAAGVLARIAVLAWIPTRPVSDFYGFFRVAQNVAATGRFQAKPGVPDGGRSPAYPILLATVFRAVSAGGALGAAKAANLGLGALAATVGAALARRLWGSAAGLWTAALVSFLPRPLLMTDLVASENLLAPLLFLFLLACAESWTRASFRSAAGVGLLAGLMCLTRAVLYAVPLVWLAGVVAKRRPWRRAVGELAVVLAIEHLVLLPWALRNADALGRATPFHAVGGVGLFIANNEHATGEWYRWGDDLERLRPGVFGQGAIAIDDAACAEALRWIRENPGLAVLGYLGRLKTILTDDAFPATFAIFAEAIPAPAALKPVLPGPHALKNHPRTVVWVLRVSGLLLFAAAAGGFAILVRRARAESRRSRALAAGFLCAALYLPLAAAASAANGRSRWMTEDAVTPVAGMFLAAAARRRLSSPSGVRAPSPGTPPSGAS